MRTTVSIPEKAMERLLQATGTTSRNEAVNQAINLYLAFDAQRKLLALQGTVDIISNDELEALDENEFRSA